MFHFTLSLTDETYVSDLLNDIYSIPGSINFLVLKLMVA